MKVYKTLFILFQLDNATDLSNLLSKFRSWVNINNPEDDSDPLHVDNAALLVR